MNEKTVFSTSIRRINYIVGKLYLKILSQFRKRHSSIPIKKIPVDVITHQEALEMGRKREFVRPEDSSGLVLMTLKNKKTGVTVVAPYHSHQSLDIFGKDWEVVENLFKE